MGSPDPAVSTGLLHQLPFALPSASARPALGALSDQGRQRQNSSGGKERLGDITTAGNGYLRQMLVVGAMAVIRYAQHDSTRRPWLVQLVSRRPTKVAAIALANKTARTVWALMTPTGHSGSCLGNGIDAARRLLRPDYLPQRAFQNVQLFIAHAGDVNFLCSLH
jgi:hypothetical protein